MEAILDELDAQETHVRRIARRIDRGSQPFTQVELRLSHHLHIALEFIHKDAEESSEDRPDAAHVVVARAKSQAIAIVRLAKEVQNLGGTIDPDAIEIDLDRARAAMPH